MSLRDAAFVVTIGLFFSNVHAADVPPPPQLGPGIDYPRGFETRKLDSFSSEAQGYLRGEAGKVAGKGIPETDVDGLTLRAYVQNVVETAEDWRYVKPRLAFEPVDLAGTVFDSFTLVGGLAEGHRIEKGFVSVKRAYRSMTGESVVLYEWDFNLTGGGGVIVEELVNARVRHSPAIMTILTSPGGSAVTRIFWVTDGRAFRLLVDRHLGREERIGQLTQWAEAVAGRRLIGADSRPR